MSWFLFGFWFLFNILAALLGMICAALLFAFAIGAGLWFILSVEERLFGDKMPKIRGG